MLPPNQGQLIWGLTAFHSETGTEGGHWAVEDVRGFDIRRFGSMNSASYYGLHLLEDGDRLTIYSPKSFQDWQAGETEPRVAGNEEVLWEGTVELVQYPPFTEDAEGFWIHSAPKNMDREQWAKLFFTPHPCRLLKVSTRPYPVGAWKFPRDGYSGLFVGPREIIFLSDGSMRWEGGGKLYEESAPYELRQLMGRIRERERVPFQRLRVELELDGEFPSVNAPEEERARFTREFERLRDEVDAWVIERRGVVNGFSLPEKYVLVELPQGREAGLEKLDGVRSVRV